MDVSKDWHAASLRLVFISGFEWKCGEGPLGCSGFGLELFPLVGRSDWNGEAAFQLPR